MFQCYDRQVQTSRYTNIRTFSLTNRSMWKIPLFKILSDENDERSIKRIIERGTDWAVGPEITKFEDAISKYTGAKYCTVFNSGTSALHAVLVAHKINSGAKVGVPSFSFIATANSALFVGAKPVFIDIEEQNLGIDPAEIEKITSKQKIDVVIPVHYAGLPCKIGEIMEIAKRKKILIIEDAAESFGAKYGGQMTGTFGDSSILSFAPNKIITTGEGGAVITSSKKIHERLLLVRSHGRNDTSNYFFSSKKAEYVSLGYNFRMPSMVAALGLTQLGKIKQIIELRRKVASSYDQLFSKINKIQIPKQQENAEHVYQMYSVRIKNGKRDQLANSLNKAGIMTKVYFAPIHLTPFYKKLFKFKGGELPITEKVSKEILTLPLYPHMPKSETNLVGLKVKRFFEQ